MRFRDLDAIVDDLVKRARARPWSSRRSICPPPASSLKAWATSNRKLREHASEILRKTIKTPQWASLLRQPFLARWLAAVHKSRE